MGKAALYPRLAARNIRLNKKFYLPYILTCVAAVAMFYIMCFLAYNKGMAEHGTLLAVMQLGLAVIAIFSAIILLYTNSFLMKRRQKEIGLYNVLGMGKGNIAAVLFYETLLTFLISFVLGIALGVIFSKLVLLLLAALVRFDVPYGFEISVTGIIYSAILFLVIFLVTLISNLIRIKLSKPVELLHGGESG